MVEWTEIAWTVVTAVGVWFAVRLFTLARGDLAVLRERGVNSARAILARMNLRFGAIIAAVESWYLFLGILAMTQPPPGRTRTGLGWFTVVVFIGIQALFVLGLALNLRDRRRLTDG